MKTLILFYSYSGKTKAIAQELIEKKSADMVEIKDVKRPVKLKAYTAGILAAIRGKAWPIQPLDVDWSAYESLVLLAPVWADNPAPPMNTVLEMLPPEKNISIKMVSMSGKSDCRARLEEAIIARACTLVDFEDIKA